MFFCIKSVILLLSSLISYIQCADNILELEGCNELVRKDPRKLDFLKLGDFDNDFPKSYEVFRMKMFFCGKKFVFGFKYNNNRNYVLFRPYEESFALFANFSSLYKTAEPCAVDGSKSAFEMNKYTQMEAFLTHGEFM